jgi:hypothetical protein
VGAPVRIWVTLVFSGPLSYPVSDFTTRSKYVLYDNGAFWLDLVSPFLGVYQQENGRVHFDFGANRTWDASGDLNGDLLEVRDGEPLQSLDFEDAVYRHSQ